MFDSDIRDQETRTQEEKNPLDDLSSALKDRAASATKIVGDTLGVDTSIITNTLKTDSSSGSSSFGQAADPQCKQALESSMGVLFKLTKFL